jgi:DNA ligase-associated metallophosphoesterase
MSELPKGGVTLTLAGEELWLLPERALFWPATATLLVADAHFGKAEVFRVAGLPVPHGTTGATLARLDRLLAALPVRRLCFLGDFLHAASGRRAEMFAELGAWRLRHVSVEMLLIRGNHDRSAGDPPAMVGLEVVNGPLLEGPLALAHHPITVPGHHVLAGHLHPCARLLGPAGDRVRLSCFWGRRDGMVLPAFGEFTGSFDITPSPGDGVWVVANDEVIAVRLREGGRFARKMNNRREK